MNRTSDNKARRIARKTFLKGAGATLVLVAGGGVWCAAHQGVFGVGEGPAYEPWKDWRADEGEGPVRLVRVAILAANAHNSQPWLFRAEESRIDIFADHERHIGTVDPYLREMYVSVGCALENLLLAAGANGYGYELTLLPDASNPAHAARVDLSPSVASASELYDAIPDRHTNRGPYDTGRAVPRETLQALRKPGEEAPEVTVFWFDTDAERRRMGGLILEATEAIVADEEQPADNHGWDRYDRDELQRYRGGLTLDALVTQPLTNFAAKRLPPPSREQGDRSWLRSTRQDVVGTAAAFGILAVRDKWEDAQRLRGGRAWQPGPGLRRRPAALHRRHALHRIGTLSRRLADLPRRSGRSPNLRGPGRTRLARSARAGRAPRREVARGRGAAPLTPDTLRPARLRSQLGRLGLADHPS